jgi:hypothetical protein
MIVHVHSVSCVSEKAACVLSACTSRGEMSRKLSVHLHSVPCVRESCVCDCMCLHVSRAGLVSAFCGLNPGPSMSAFSSVYQGLSVCLHLVACIKS